jgi:hypothetical protein
MPMANIMVSIAKQLRKEGVLERRLGELAQ